MVRCKPSGLRHHGGGGRGGREHPGVRVSEQFPGELEGAAGPGGLPVRAQLLRGGQTEPGARAAGGGAGPHPAADPGAGLLQLPDLHPNRRVHRAHLPGLQLGGEQRVPAAGQAAPVRREVQVGETNAPEPDF